MTDWSEKILMDRVKKQLRDSADTKSAMEKQCIPSIIAAAGIIAGALRRIPSNNIFFAGNGGSAADSQHIATEFVVRLSSTRERKALPAIALTTDTSTLTAAGNDYGFENIFARQVEALGKMGDVLICISTSANSVNLVKAAEIAKGKQMKLIGLLGTEPGKLGPMMNISINIPAKDTGRIQEGHITTGHILVDLVETLLFDGAGD